MKINGNTLIEWGIKPSPHFKQALEAARAAQGSGASEDEQRAAALQAIPLPQEQKPLRDRGDSKFHVNLIPYTEDEKANLDSVEEHMRELMRTPTLVSGAIMPDACPTGGTPGTIPVGGVVSAKDAIHPGFHSADICCSMAVSVFSDVDPKLILDAGMRLSHFGPGGRPKSYNMRPSDDLLDRFSKNRYLSIMIDVAQKHFATQGDGNHFFYVGHLKSTGRVALVTHHGSRKPGAMLYERGMETAEQFRRKISPETSPHNAWIPSETDEGRSYWDALQIIRTWTKKSHFAIHDVVGHSLGLKVRDRFWNEHNFVFRKTDGLFYHAKGATPAYPFFSEDTNGLTLIPLNMAENILIVRGLDAPNGLGFAPHGAGRNMSRTAYVRANAGKTDEEMIAEQAPGIDVRYFSGIPDVSELPRAYKSALQVRRQIDQFGLAEVVDEIVPYGNIMAGDWQKNAPWRNKKAK